MARRNPYPPGQTDLFDGTWELPARADTGFSGSGLGGKADDALTVLDGIHHGRYGLINGAGRPVELIEDGDKCRITELEDTIESLVERSLAVIGEATSCHHGVIVKRVDILNLTPSGKKLYYRWSALALTSSGKAV